MFKPGDKVRIPTTKEVKKLDKVYGNTFPGYNDEMKKYGGKVCTIASKKLKQRGHITYNIVEDGGYFIWREDWLERYYDNFFSEEDFLI